MGPSTNPPPRFFDTPIHRVPADVLILIFHLALGSRIPEEPHVDWEKGPAPSKAGLSSLLAITHVCHPWRTLALGTPTLWNVLDDLKIDRMRAFCDRSQSMPLSLSASWWSIKEAHAIAPRLRRVNIADSHIDLCDILGQVSTPALEVLTSYSKPWDETDTLKRAATLKALATVSCWDWIPDDAMPKLTHLYLGDLTIANGAMAKLGHMLAGTPLLESLHLSAHVRDEEDVVKLAQPVALPNLHSFCITDSRHSDASFILSSLMLPSTTLIRLDHLYFDQSDPFPLQSVPGLSHLSVAATHRFLHILAESPENGVWIQSIGRGPSNCQHFVETLERTLDLSSIRSLHVTLEYWPLLPALLSKLPALTTLAMSAQAGEDPHQMDSMLQAVTVALESDSRVLPSILRRHHPPVLCPKLERLSLQGSRYLPLDFYNVERCCNVLANSLTSHDRPLRELIIDGDRETFEPLPSILTEAGISPAVTLVCGRWAGLCKWTHSAMWDSDLPTRYWGLFRRNKVKDRLPWNFEEVGTLSA